MTEPNQSICVRLPRELLDRLAEVARERGCSRDEAAVQMLRQALVECCDCPRLAPPGPELRKRARS